MTYNRVMYYVYILKNESGGLYYGCTGDLRLRLEQHNTGQSPSTRGHVWKLVYYEAYVSKLDAFARERRLKFQGQALAQLKRRIRESLNES